MDETRQRIGVAVGKGSSSLDALKWALDNENLQPGDTLHLLHVHSPLRTVVGPLGDHVLAMHASPGTLKKRQDEQVKKITNSKWMNLYKSLCEKKEVKLILHYGGNDVVQEELVELIKRSGLTRLVIGSSTTNVRSRVSKGENIAKHVVEHTPNACRVIVICKGRLVDVHVGGANNNGRIPLGSSSMDSLRNPPNRTINAHLMRSYTRSLEYTDHLIIPNDGPSNSNDESFHLTEEIIKCEDIHVDEASNEYHGKVESIQNNQQESKHETLSFKSQNSILEIGNEDYLSHEAQVLQNQLDQAKCSIARVKVETEQHAKDINHAYKVVANAQGLINESERQRQDALKEAEVARHQSFEDSRKYKETMAEVQKVSQEKEILRKDYENKIDALRKDYENKIDALRKAVAFAWKQVAMKEEALAALRWAQRKYTEYSFKELEIATDNFHKDNKLGEGGYGPVFKGKLLHTPVAVKVLEQEGVQGWQQFQREVELLSNVHHPHLVMLLGACPERACIVYEYMSNGSLEDRLTCKGGTPPLPWYVRFRICTEVATALLFLHSRPVPIVHRDMKPGNILLDQHYVSKIGDVGIAKLVSDLSRTTMLKGTMGYMDPHYQQTGIVSCQLDVFALGIVMLQLLTGSPALGVVNKVKDAQNKKKFHEVLDKAAVDKEAGDWPLEEAMSLATISLRCAEFETSRRPDLETEMLPILVKLRECGDQAALKVASASSSSSHSTR